MSQNFSSLEHGHCRDPCTNAAAVFSKRQLKVNFEKKDPALLIEKFPYLELQRYATMLQHLIIHCSLHYLSSGRLREVENKGKFQTFTSKSGRGRLREVIAYKRFQI